MNITMSPQQPMLSVTKAIPFQSGIFADVWRVTQERYYQVKKVCRSALINPALICLEQLALQSSAAGSAQNVGIQILDRTGEVLILDGATFSAKTDLIDGTNILPFQARYIALGQSVAGTANADATFKVQYL